MLFIIIFFFWKRGDDVSVTPQNELFALDE